MIQWVEPDTWMESMKGARWEALINQYNRKFKEAVGGVSKKALKLATQKFKESFADFQKPFWKGGVQIRPGIGDLFTWRVGSAQGGVRLATQGGVRLATQGVAGIDIFDDIIATTEPSSSEQYHLVIRRDGLPIWKSPKIVSETVEITGGCVYFLEQGSIPLWKNRLMCYTLNTGKLRLVYEEKDKTHQLNLIRGHNRCLFMSRSNYRDDSLYHVHGTRAEKLYEGPKGSVFPVGNGPEDPCYFVAGAAGWRPVGETLKSIVWPSLIDTIVFVDLQKRWIALLNMGITTLYDCSGHLLKKGVFVISDYNHIWDGSRPRYEIIEPGAEPNKRPYAQTRYHTTDSKDGTRVPFTITSKSATPKGMIVSIYGAYGVQSTVSSRRWRPYLEAGWCICTAMIRGGGDHDAAWAEAARGARREKGVEDAEAVIRAARRVAGLAASQICIYGRSAGGYTVGALVNRHPTGILFGAVYTEAPFVDVLNTMSNPILPAALAESGEFGHPERIEDFETMLRLSPVQNVPATVKGIFILCRTALGDIEVAAYEPVKWITRLGTGLLYVKSGTGHFTETDDAFQDMAEDFCLLQAWLAN